MSVHCRHSCCRQRSSLPLRCALQAPELGQQVATRAGSLLTLACKAKHGTGAGLSVCRLTAEHTDLHQSHVVISLRTVSRAYTTLTEEPAVEVHGRGDWARCLTAPANLAKPTLWLTPDQLQAQSSRARQASESVPRLFHAHHGSGLHKVLGRPHWRLPDTVQGHAASRTASC